LLKCSLAEIGVRGAKLTAPVVRGDSMPAGRIGFGWRLIMVIGWLKGVKACHHAENGRRSA